MEDGSGKSEDFNAPSKAARILIGSFYLALWNVWKQKSKLFFSSFSWQTSSVFVQIFGSIFGKKVSASMLVLISVTSNLSAISMVCSKIFPPPMMKMSSSIFWPNLIASLMLPTMRIPSSNPVSYTHLDVYKRQRFGNLLSDFCDLYYCCLLYTSRCV